MKLLAAVCSLVVLSAGSLAAAPDGERELQDAFGPYYAALVASARGNVDQTERHVMLFASRWETIARQATAPTALRADPGWPAFVQHVRDVVQDVRKNCRARNMVAAHARLESIRLVLRDLDARHSRMSLDDALTDFHDAMERMIGHVAGVNEIVLRPKDFEDVDEDYRAARTAWRSVQSLAGALAQQDAWRTAFDEIERTLSAIGRELQARRPEPLAGHIQGLHDKYYTLLLAVARSRG